jgi:4-amino-4-deoxy-L-arabinose transferase-like glycosyltransferase
VVDATTAATEPATGVGVRGWRLVLVLLVVGFVVHAPALTARSWNSDEAYLAAQAQVLEHGGSLYFDTVDRKPPVVPYLYAATFRLTGSDTLLAVRVLAVLANVLSAWLLAIEARRRWSSRAGLVAGLLFLAASAAFFAKDTQTANFEVFMVPLMIGSVFLAARRRPLASGAALGLATLTKQTAATTLLVLAWIAWRSHDRARERVRALGSIALGWVAPIAIAAAAFGAHEFVRWVFTGNEGYLDVGGDLGYAVWLGIRQSSFLLVVNLALVVLACLAWRRRRDDADLWMWVLASAIAVTSGLRFFGHYYLQLWPPVCLLAASTWERLTHRARTAVVLAGVIAVIGFAVPAWRTVDSETETTAHHLAEYARAHTASGERIFVWGHLPEVYWWSDRVSATRFETTGFLDGQSGGRPPDHVGTQYGAPGAWADFEADLAAHPPALIFDLSPADVRNAHYAPPSRFPRFGNYLADHYHRIATIDRVGVYAPNS